MASDKVERVARALYDTMERLSDDAPGPLWDALDEVYKPWYRTCAEAMIDAALSDTEAL